MTTFYLVRHAHAVWQLDEQHRLSPRGRADAERVAERLEDCRLSAIYASPYPRAIQTVEPLAERLGLHIQVEPDLRERKLSAGRVPDFERAVAWAWDHPAEALPGGEPNRQALARIRTLLDRLAEQHADDSVVLATHGSLLSLLLHDLDASFGLEDWAQMTMPDVFRVREEYPTERLWHP